jgi:hypothetical protein
MFSRKRRARRTAAQAWEYLADAMASAAGGGTRPAGKAGHKGAGTTGRAGSTVSAVADEAWARANAAANALAGRMPPMPWRLVLGAGLLGAAGGWFAATARRAPQAAEPGNGQLLVTETEPAPTFDG